MKVQLAVRGPAGEEIRIDNFGRVKVQFHWDRRGKRDERSSYWVSMAQSTNKRKRRISDAIGRHGAIAPIKHDFRKRAESPRVIYVGKKGKLLAEKVGYRGR